MMPPPMTRTSGWGTGSAARRFGGEGALESFGGEGELARAMGRREKHRLVRGGGQVHSRGEQAVEDAGEEAAVRSVDVAQLTDRLRGEEEAEHRALALHAAGDAVAGRGALDRRLQHAAHLLETVVDREVVLL